MGYQQRIYKYTCPNCAKEWAMTLDSTPAFSHTCSACQARNEMRPLPKWPDVPRSLYLGHDSANVMKVYPVPPGHEDDPWADPYSVRSFVWQAGRHFGGCWYKCGTDEWLYGEPIFRDTCAPVDADGPSDEYANCSILTGWSTGKTTCPTWAKLCALCQTPTEQRFLQDYIRYVKDRQFPMLLPQVRVGIAERRRPDFVVFIPVHYWNYKQLAIQLDGSHSPNADDDKARDEYVAEYGYETMSLRPGAVGYLREVQRLVEHIDINMRMYETDAFEVATPTSVRKCTPEIPF
jgi:hypothetical protein